MQLRRNAVILTADTLHELEEIRRVRRGTRVREVEVAPFEMF